MSIKDLFSKKVVSVENSATGSKSVESSDYIISFAGGASSSAGEQTSGTRKYVQIETSGTVSFAL